jgi:hypothetical protein
MTRPSNHSALLTEPTIKQKNKKKQKKTTKTKKTKTITLSMNETIIKDIRHII